MRPLFHVLLKQQPQPNSPAGEVVPGVLRNQDRDPLGHQRRHFGDAGLL